MRNRRPEPVPHSWFIMNVIDDLLLFLFVLKSEWAAWLGPILFLYNPVPEQIHIYEKKNINMERKPRSSLSALRNGEVNGHRMLQSTFIYMKLFRPAYFVKTIKLIPQPGLEYFQVLYIMSFNVKTPPTTVFFICQMACKEFIPRCCWHFYPRLVKSGILSLELWALIK